ncbi:MAG: hypothetical protein HUK19_05790 [Fibrobacter sp.]|nr:hypothetical protein [Fibrobacter sp.]
MLLRVPDFYRDFKCLADKCTDTCCVGWEIDVDKRSLNKYKKWSNKITDNCSRDSIDEQRIKFAQKILANIEDRHFKLLPGDRCPFLTDDGLCEMICHLGCGGTDCDESGENVLCDICREHPRFVEVYGDIMEKGLGLCCEEAVRLLLAHRRKEDPSKSSTGIKFVETQVDDEPDEMPEGAQEARDAIFEERNTIFSILNNTSVPLNQRLIEILDFAEAVSDDENMDKDNRGDNKEQALSHEDVKQSWIRILEEGESFGPPWDAAYQRIIRRGTTPKDSQDKNPHKLFSDDDGARIIAYMIFRYYTKSLFDGDSLTKVQFSIYFWIVLKHFGNELSADTPEGADLMTRKINAVKLLSKQTEYSEEIMEILADNFYGNPAFSVDQFRRILSDENAATC